MKNDESMQVIYQNGEILIENDLKIIRERIMESSKTSNVIFGVRPPTFPNQHNRDPLKFAIKIRNFGHQK